MANSNDRFEKVEKQYANEEKYVQPLSKDNLDDDVFNALEVDEDALPINKIIPDPTQPRRIIPHQFLDCLEDGYGAVIGAWEEYVFDSTDDFPTVDLLKGKKSVGDYVNDDPIVMAFGALVAFAANIHDVGLNHPIGVVTRGDVYRIIYGERRWTAFQFLNHYLGDYDKIPAKVANVSEWELAKMQASENSHRPELNAIAKARMFAKLLIAARTEGGERYDSWKQLVVDCDRPYWAQVANGEIHRIPRGMGEQFVYAMNISVEQMRQYRNLLKLFSDHNLAHKVNNALWMLGDEGDWPERFLREIGQYLQVDDVHEILYQTDGYTVTTVTVSQTEEALREAVESAKEAAESKKKHPTPPLTVDGEGDEIPPLTDKSTWESYKWVGREGWAGPQKVFVVGCPSPNSVEVEFMKDGEKQTRVIGVGALYEHAAGTTPPSPLNPPATQGEDSDNADNVKPDGTFSYMDKNGVAIKLHDTVMTRRGAEATVIGFNGRYVEIKSDNVSKGHYPEWLEVIPTPNPSPKHQGGEQSGLEKSVYPDDLDALKGRRVGYKGDAAIIVAKSGEGKVYIQWGKERLDVAVDELDFDYPPSVEGKPAPDTPQLKGLVFAEDGTVSEYLQTYSALAGIAQDEQAIAAFEWLIGLTYERTNRQQMDAAMNHVLNHMEIINKRVEEYVFEQFRLKLDELN